MAWHNSTRYDRLPNDWHTRVRAVKARAQGNCEATHHVDACNGKGQEVDHIVQGDHHDLANLQLLSTPCHQAKTRAENAARNTLHAKLRHRPDEKHPGARA